MAILHRVKTVSGLIPRYVSRFACIGPTCEDTCCVGWRVSLDKKTYKAYRQSTDPVLAPRFARDVIRTEGANASSGNERDYGRMALEPVTTACTMLDDNKLCAIQARLGESYLSDTCSQYPRLSREIDGQFQQGLQLSCPEAARQALLAPDAFEFDQSTLQLRPATVFTVANRHGLPVSVVDELRIFCLNLLRLEGVPLWQRLALLGVFCERLDAMLAAGEQHLVPKLPEEFSAMLAQGDFMAELDGMRPDHAAQAVVFATLLAGKKFVTASPAHMAVNASVAAGLGANQHGIVGRDQLIDGYTHGAGRLPEALVAAPHLLDHYILNEMFTILFPFDGGTPYDNYLQLIARFGVLRLMLAAQCNTDGPLPDVATLVATVQIHCRRFQHDPEFSRQINEALTATGWHTLDKLFAFLRT
jgi:lysine-N-methylase